MNTQRTQQKLTQPSVEKYFTGILEIDKGHTNHRNNYSSGARLIEISIELDHNPDSPAVYPKLVHKYKLRQGNFIECKVERRNGMFGVTEIQTINGLTTEAWVRCTEFKNGVAIDPTEQIVLANEPKEYSLRIIDLICPIGKGQRALIVAPPKAGKTILLKQIAHSLSANTPNISLVVLLIDERPEEVTDFRRSVRGEVFASSSDSDRESHVRLAQLVLDYTKRKVEAGQDVVLLIDSLTKMGRAFNSFQPGSGRTMSGGVDIRALEIPKKIFGAARALENAGSLTIIATILVDTNSRMDELIFQEFKGTGNMELVLNRELANNRIFPAINIQESGTRHDEILFGRHTEKHYELRRAINRSKPKDAILSLIKLFDMYPTNRKLLSKVSKSGDESNEE